MKIYGQCALCVPFFKGTMVWNGLKDHDRVWHVRAQDKRMIFQISFYVLFSRIASGEVVLNFTKTFDQTNNET